MEYLIGALIPVALFACVYVGYNFGRTAKKVAPRVTDDETTEKARRIQAGFQDLMSYDVTKAIGKR